MICSTCHHKAGGKTMKSIRVHNLCKMLPLAVLLLFAGGHVAYSATIAWTNTAGGNWNVAANWSPNQVPAPGDTANITASGTYAITLNANANAQNLTIGGAASRVQTLQGNGFTLAATNASMSSGGVLGLTNSTFAGALTIAGGAVLSVNGSTLAAQVTVESGGEFLVLGSAVDIGGGQATDTNDWLWVQSGGQVNAASGTTLNLYSVMTNAGLVNMTNQAIVIVNDGTSANDGGLVNQAGGVINLISSAGIYGYYGFDYLVNQGTINVLSTNSTSTINVDNFTNLAALNALYGTVQLQGTHVVLEPSETLSVGLNSATEYGKFSLSGNAALAGTFKVQLNNGFTPAVGSSFTVLSYGSFSGGFATFSSPRSGIVWQPVYGSTALTLVAQPAIVLLPPGTNVAINVNGTPGNQVILLTSTNLTLPLVNWTPVATNTFDPTRYLSFTNGMNPNNPRQFFTFKLQ
jgi:hypothetical protein